ncbi:lactose transport system permease protein LacG [mine drainage metagenome]|uniref:Lactose transport system permease protein LacG n=1 Tax=mine drainage metagenome TaxID=410659 RepID=A0A1J5Q602_9ZZZZ
MSTATEAIGSKIWSPDRGRKNLKRKGVSAWVVFIVVFIVALVWLFPLWMAVVNSVKTPKDFLLHGPLTLPRHLHWTSISGFWNDVDFPQKLMNSTLISLFVAIFGVTLSFLTAYAIGIGRIKGRFFVLGIFMVAFTVPQESLVFPLFRLSIATHLYNSIWAIVIIFSVIYSAFGTYMLSVVLSAFPPEILEAAKIDGANTRRILWNVVLPIVRPTMFALATFFFVWVWNEYLIPLILLADNANQTVSVSLGVTSGQYTSDPTTQAAAALLGIIPSVIFYLIFQRTLSRGVTLGAVK